MTEREIMTLYSFQDKALKKLNFIYHTEIANKVILEAPTGSGKTNIALKLIDDWFDNFTGENITFIWIAPGTGFLHKQSYERAKHICKNVKSNIIESTMPNFERKQLYFVNWEKINKISNKFNLSFGDSQTWASSIDQLKLESKIMLIIDEEHLAHSDKSNAIIEQIKPDFLLRLSATPKDHQGIEVVQVSEKEVIDAGLIRTEIVINDEVKHGDVFNDRIAIQLAIKKQTHLTKLYLKENIKLKPLILIQIPNANDNSYLLKVKEMVLAGDISESNIAIWLSEEKINLSTIDQADVLIFKNAIATGWDYPRAQILVKLRDVSSKSFHIQTLGRIRRNISGVPFINGELNKGYLYTIDEKLKSEAINHFNGKETIYSLLKKDYFDLLLPKAKRTIYSPVDKNIFLQNEFMNFLSNKNFSGMNLSENLVNTLKGSEKHIIQIKTKQSLANEDIKRQFWRTVSNLAVKSRKFNYQELNAVLKKMFHAQSHGHFLKLQTKDYYSFISSQEQFFQEIVSNISKKMDIINFKETVNSLLPKTQKILTSPDYTLAKKSMYNNYPVEVYDSAAEKRFIDFLEYGGKFDSWMKNSVSIDSPLNIIYEVSGEYKNFKPDFVVNYQKKPLIVEVKGENDIDLNTKQKYEAAKEFFSTNNLQFILVRIRKGELVYIDGASYEDDLKKYKELNEYGN